MLQHKHNAKKKESHRGRLLQIPIYLNKMFRMFIYMDDWKVLPMSALVAGAVCLVVGNRMFKNMEGTTMGALALTCICIWNGFFNSIQSVCRERNIIKREHRNGMHISSYIFAHMIYQALICLAQTLITLVICVYGGMKFPEIGFVTGKVYVDFAISLFLITYAADMLSLLISCFAKNTTSAMTIMPFMLIFELLFSDNLFSLGETLKPISNLSFAKWGVSLIAALSNYNSQPMVSVWNQMNKFKNVEISGTKPIGMMVDYITQNNMKEQFCLQVGQNAQKAEFATTLTNIGNCWIALLLFAILFAVFSVLILEGIDRDKR